METTKKYDYENFKELFNEIAFDFEPQYQPTITDKQVRFYKTTITIDGIVERKGNYSYWNTDNPTIWPKIVKLAEMLTETRAEKVLYENN